MSDRMLRLLLTCLAFLTGLVAVGTPASAMFAESSVAGAAAEVCDSDKEDARCECRTTIRVRDWRLALERAGLATVMSDLFTRFRVAGFNTYGEQHSGMHVNQTFVGLAFMDHGAPGDSHAA